MKNKLLSLLLLLSVSAFSQVPGYMGKRFTVGYSLGIVPDQYHVLTHTLNLNYVVGKRKELCLAATYFESAFEASDYSKSFEEISATRFSLGLKSYSGRVGACAPVGMYLKWEAVYCISTVSYVPHQEVIDYNIYNYVYGWQPGGSFKMMCVGGAFNIGKQRIFFDKLVLDYGLRGSILVPFKSTAKDSYEGSRYGDAWATLIVHELITARIGIGFLAF